MKQVNDGKANLILIIEFIHDITYSTISFPS